MRCKMSSEGSGPSKDSETNENEYLKPNQIGANLVDYAATGARPKVFPVPTLPRQDSRKSQKAKGSLSESNRRTTEESEDEELQDAFNSMTFDQPDPAVGFGTRPSSGGKLWTGNDDDGSFGIGPDGKFFGGRETVISGGKILVNGGEEMEEDAYSGEPSTVEITEELTPEQLDEQFARSLEWEDKNQTFGGFNQFGNLQPMEEGSQEDEAGGAVAQESRGEGFRSLGSGGNVGGTAEEFTICRGKKRAPNLSSCPYCNRSYEVWFLPDHISQCVDNPAVSDERQDLKLALEASAIADWRSVPNPVTQSEWPTPIAQFPASSHHSNVDASGFSIGVWDQPDVAFAGDEAAAASFGGKFSDDNDNAMIPCEFCTLSLPFNEFIQHQQTCPEWK